VPGSRKVDSHLPRDNDLPSRSKLVATPAVTSEPGREYNAFFAIFAPAI
jgi:hypothetical protein